MELSVDRLEEYEANLECVRKVMDDIMNRMKGHRFSYREKITTRDGVFSHKKLAKLLDEMLSVWEAAVWRQANERDNVEESLAASYIAERKELYRNYLYAVMRCSLVQGGFKENRNSTYEKTNFSFVLGEAKEFAKEYVYITALEKSVRKENPEIKPNALLYDLHYYFGFHLYPLFVGKAPDAKWQCGIDWFLKKGEKMPSGCGKAFFAKDVDFVHDPLLHNLDKSNSYFLSMLASSDFAPWSEDYELYGGFEWSEPSEEVLEVMAAQEASEDYQRWLEEEAERYTAEEVEKEDFWTQTKAQFAAREEYIAACDRFWEAFRKARPEVLRFFAEDVERIVDIYLMEIGAAVLDNVDDSLNITKRLKLQVLEAAKRFAEEIG